MAVVRARSSPPYALIVFVFLTVISAGIAIYLAVRIGEADRTRDAAEKDLARVKRASDNPFVDTLLKGNDRASALGAARDQISALKNIIETNDDKDHSEKPYTEVVVDAGKALVAAGAGGQQLLPTVTSLATKLKDTGESVKALQAQLKGLSDQNDQAAAAAKAREEALQKTINDQKEQLVSSQNMSAQERKEKEDNAKKAEDELTNVKAAAEKAQVKHLLEQQQAEADIKKLQQQNVDLRNQIKLQATPEVAAAPAGHILRAAPGTGECYIDIGEKDRVVVGLTFSVHDPRLGVRGKISGTDAAGDAEAAGKGGIEVLQVGPRESLCRIEMTTPGQTIQPGDLISNAVFQNSKNRKTHFVVIGDFDLDGDGVATPGEHDRVVHMITSWGGIIDTDLSPQTDYLLAGARPSSPTGKVQDQEGSAADKRRNDQKSYDDAVVEAKRDSVSILNVNRFLALVGYYNTSIVR